MINHLFRSGAVLTVTLLVLSCSIPSNTRSDSPSPQRPLTNPQNSARRLAPAATLEGKVVSIEDGDTIVVLDNANRTHKIRLQSIDAPEGGQAFGDRSRENLSREVFARQVTVEWSKRDRYGRIVGKVLFGGRDVCLAQVRAGMAWHYKYYQNEQTAEDQMLYAEAEDQARAASRGLWVDANPTPPWDFRRSR